MGFSNTECAPSVTPQRCTHFLMFCSSPKLLQSGYPNCLCFCGNRPLLWMEHRLKCRQQNFLQASLGLTVVCCSMLALWVPHVSHCPHASWRKKETINFMIPERVCKSQQCLRNVWRLKPLIHLHSKNERINKTYILAPPFPLHIARQQIQYLCPADLREEVFWRHVKLPCCQSQMQVLEPP